MIIPHGERIQTVSELTHSIRGLLETTFPFVTVTGEISNLRHPSSGHLYFTLKDSDAQIRAVLFKPQRRYVACTPGDGLAVLCRGRLSVYEPRGEYQLIVDYLDTKGAGALRIAFEQLKARLAAEGLFDPTRKKRLPFLPGKIALITSPQGAAVVDFLRMAHNRFPGVPIEIHPVRVQGEGAAGEIAQAIDEANRRRTSEVIVLCRGGGSSEDLWAFNEEMVARAIARSGLPVVSAVGHEVDVTIADLVADARAATPTAAAELVLPDGRLLRRKATDCAARLTNAVQRQVALSRRQVATCQRLLGDPTLMVAHFLLRLDHARETTGRATELRLHRNRSAVRELVGRLMRNDPRQRLASAHSRALECRERLSLLIHHQLERKHGLLARDAGRLDAVSPLAVLGRGYAVVRTADAGTVIRSASQTAVGEGVQVTLHHGSLECTVTAVNENAGRPTPPRR
ncbi:MAG: exodeoxyribonuclease VII large subunit [Thermodesulfobacteriota bacterium]